MDPIAPWKTFLTVVKEKSISQAARSLQLTQSAVSQQIKQLEELYRVPLFVRKRRGVELTMAGVIIEQKAKQMVQLMEDSLTAVDVSINEIIGTLTIGASMTIAEYIVPSLLSEFRKSYPSIKINLYTGNTKEIGRRLTEGELLIGFVEAPLFDSRIIQRPFLEDELGLIVTPRHSLSLRSNVQFRDLVQDRLLIREAGSGTRSVLEAALNKEQLSLRDFKIVFESNNPQTLKSLVLKGYGISIMSTWTVKDETRAGQLKFIPIGSRSTKRSFQVVWLENTSQDPLLASFLQIVLQPNLEHIL